MLTNCFPTWLAYTPSRNWPWKLRSKLYPCIKTTLSNWAVRSHMRCTCSKQPLRWSPKTELTSPPPPPPPPSSISDVFLYKAGFSLTGFFFSSLFLLLFYEHVQTSKNVTNGFAREPVAGAGELKIEGEDGQILWPHHDTLLIKCMTPVWILPVLSTNSVDVWIKILADACWRVPRGLNKLSAVP